METLVSVGGQLLGTALLFVLYHWSFVRGKVATPPADVPVAQPVPQPAPAPAPQGSFLATHPLLARLASRFDQVVLDAAAAAAANVIPAALGAAQAQQPPAPGK